MPLLLLAGKPELEEEACRAAVCASVGLRSVRAGTRQHPAREDIANERQNRVGYSARLCVADDALLQNNTGIRALRCIDCEEYLRYSTQNTSLAMQKRISPSDMEAHSR